MMPAPSAQSAPRLVLINLENSRAFRVAWLLEELGLAYENRVFERINGKRAPPDMCAGTGVRLNKSPVLLDYGPASDGNERPQVTVWESGACLQYLADRYGQHTRLLPSASDAAGWQRRQDVLAWLHFSESLMLHTLPVVYVRWFAREGTDDECKALLEDNMSGNIVADLDSIEAQLHEGDTGGELYLVGGELSLADFMMAMSAEYVFATKAGTAHKRWPTIERWLKQLEARPSYRRTLRNGAAHKFSLLASES